MTQSKFPSQRFFKREGGKLVLVVAQTVDDPKVAGVGNNAKVFLDDFDLKLELGTVNHGPGKLRFFGINTIQHEDYTVETYSDENLAAVTEYPITLQGLKQSDVVQNEI